MTGRLSSSDALIVEIAAVVPSSQGQPGLGFIKRCSWGLMKAFVSFGFQKKFVRPAGMDGPFPAIEGGKDQQGGLLFHG